VVDNSGGYDIRHVPGIVVFGQAKLGVGIKLTNGAQVDVAAQDCDSHRPVDSQVLQIFNYNGAFPFVVLGCPMIAEVIQNLIVVIDIVQRFAEHACLADCLDWAHQF
jgi:hypothetical protein